MNKKSGCFCDKLCLQYLKQNYASLGLKKREHISSLCWNFGCLGLVQVL